MEKGTDRARFSRSSWRELLKRHDHWFAETHYQVRVIPYDAIFHVMWLNWKLLFKQPRARLSTWLQKAIWICNFMNCVYYKIHPSTDNQLGHESLIGSIHFLHTFTTSLQTSESVWNTQHNWATWWALLFGLPLTTFGFATNFALAFSRFTGGRLDTRLVAVITYRKMGNYM